MTLISNKLVVVGGGIVGLATAWKILKSDPSISLTVIEKESKVAAHQSGRNSGVIHSGIYYKPGSLKATNCRLGKTLLEQYCVENEVPFERCGKVMIAVTDSEVPALLALHDRGKKNGVDCELIDAARLREIEPNVAGVRAIWVPETGIVSYEAVCRSLVKNIESLGGTIKLGTELIRVAHTSNHWILETSNGDINTEFIINCAGVYSDRIAKLFGVELQNQIIPFRGEYFELTGASSNLVKNLVYPVPDPNFPFLGVHATRMITGGVEVGPNAVLAFKREGYSFFEFSPGDCMESLGFSGLQRFLFKHWKMGIGEMYRSLSRNSFARAVQRLIPEVRTDDLVPHRAGIRAQALSPDGKLVDDFVIVEGRKMVHVINAPSPAATASLAIGQKIGEMALRSLQA